eukprot:gene11596-21830_t
MDCLCHIVCPCFSGGGRGNPESDFDVIPEKGDYFGETNFRGAKHGHGAFSFPNGDMYEGQWKDDKMHGFGEYRFSNGEIADQKPTKVKHNEASYSFARVVGNLKQNIKKKGKKAESKDGTDHEVRSPLLHHENANNRINYEALQGSADPRIAAQIAMERERKQRERQERVQRMKDKYNIRS